jgi:transcriptional regulator with XRE-family HTH domain
VFDVFFRKIADLRTDRDKTQQEIADMLLCNRQVYARYERGLREIPVSMVIRLAEYYDVSVDYILGLTENPKVNDNKHT